MNIPRCAFLSLRGEFARRSILAPCKSGTLERFGSLHLDKTWQRRPLSKLSMPHSVHSPSLRSISPSASSSDNTNSSLSTLYWNINLCPSQWAEDCPPYLQDLPEKSRLALSTRDEDFQVRSWDETKHFVATNRIDLFQRRPSQLRQYLKYMHELKKRYGSVMDFVQRERLHWDRTATLPLSSSSSPEQIFSDPTNYKILYNDWPYGIDEDIVHLVVWTKHLLEDDSSTDDLTPRAREAIEAFVTRTFIEVDDGVDREQLIWFRNWRSLKSIHAIEHFHVMIHKPTVEFIQRITEGDRPTCITVRD